MRKRDTWLRAPILLLFPFLLPLSVAPAFAQTRHFTGTVSRVTRDSIELRGAGRAGEVTRSFELGEESASVFLKGIRPGDRVTVWYAEGAKEIELIKREPGGAVRGEQAGEAAPESSPESEPEVILDDRAHYDS